MLISDMMSRDEHPESLKGWGRREERVVPRTGKVLGDKPGPDVGVRRIPFVDVNPPSSDGPPAAASHGLFTGHPLPTVPALHEGDLFGPSGADTGGWECGPGRLVPELAILAQAGRRPGE